MHLQNVIGFYSTNNKNKVSTMKKLMNLIDFFFRDCTGFPAMLITAFKINWDFPPTKWRRHTFYLLSKWKTHCCPSKTTSFTFLCVWDNILFFIYSSRHCCLQSIQCKSYKYYFSCNCSTKKLFTKYVECLDVN